MKQRLLLVLTGPSGTGKTTLMLQLLEAFPSEVSRVITTTTRLPRAGEQQAVDYFFETKEQFLEKLHNGGFIEHAQVYDHFYGVSKEAFLHPRFSQTDLIICLDVQGAQNLQTVFRQNHLERRLVTIFIAPHSLQELRQRLVNRGTDSESTIQKRLQTAEKELCAASQFDYHLDSQDRAHDWRCLQHIYAAEKMRV